MENEKKRITITQIISDIDNGLTRKDIKEKYSLTGPDMKLIFSHEALKNKKAKKITINFIDDTLVEETDSQISEIKGSKGPDGSISEDLFEENSDETEQNKTDFLI